jgi:hypothetical protein
VGEISSVSLNYVLDDFIMEVNLSYELLMGWSSVGKLGAMVY